MTAANWGFEWGDAFWGEEQLDVRSRLLKFVRSPNLTALVQTFADRTEDLLDATSDVAAAFDLDTAVGLQLDVIGEILQLPRYGYADSRYRTLLKIQAQLVLSSTTTTPVILEIVELFTGHPPTSYAEHYPMAYEVGAQLDDPTDAALLLEILGKATAAAYGYSVIVTDADAMFWDFEGDALADAGIWDFEGNAVTGAGTWGHMYTP